MSRPIHFEIHAAEPERAMTFYRTLLGWAFTRWDGPWPYWTIRTGDPDTPGIDGGLMGRQGAAPVEAAAVNGFVCTVNVASLDDTVARVPELGGQIALPKMPVPGIGWLAYAKDTEGNLFGCMQMDPEAR